MDCGINSDMPLIMLSFITGVGGIVVGLWIGFKLWKQNYVKLDR